MNRCWFIIAEYSSASSLHGRRSVRWAILQPSNPFQLRLCYIWAQQYLANEPQENIRKPIIAVSTLNFLYLKYWRGQGNTEELSSMSRMSALCSGVRVFILVAFDWLRLLDHISMIGRSHSDALSNMNAGSNRIILTTSRVASGVHDSGYEEYQACYSWAFLNKQTKGLTRVTQGGDNSCVVRNSPGFEGLPVEGWWRRMGSSQGNSDETSECSWMSRCRCCIDLGTETHQWISDITSYIAELLLLRHECSAIASALPNTPIMGEAASKKLTYSQRSWMLYRISDIEPTPKRVSSESIHCRRRDILSHSQLFLSLIQSVENDNAQTCAGRLIASSTHLDIKLLARLTNLGHQVPIEHATTSCHQDYIAIIFWQQIF